MMIDAVGAIYFRPVEATPAVGPRAAETRADPAVTDAEGAPLSPSPTPLADLSREKRAILAALRGDGAEGPALPTGAEGEASTSADGLSEEEQAQVEQLSARDREVRAHEQAHAAVGGAYAGAPTYTYQVGPDGQRYAVGGEVKIDVSPVPGDPEATVEKMRVVERAALAPAEPSPQDRSVAQMARAQGQAASVEAAALAAAERRGEIDENSQRLETAEEGYRTARQAQAPEPTPIFAMAA